PRTDDALEKNDQIARPWRRCAVDHGLQRHAQREQAIERLSPLLRDFAQHRDAGTNVFAALVVVSCGGEEGMRISVPPGERVPMKIPRRIGKALRLETDVVA